MRVTIDSEGAGAPAPVPRICLCSPHYPPVLSGIGDHTYFLANSLADAGVEVEVVTSVGPTDAVLYPPHPGVLVHRAEKGWGVGSLREVVSRIRGTRADLVLIQYAPHAYDRRGMTLGVNLLPSLIRAAGKRIIVNFHELYSPFGLTPKRAVGALWQRAMAFLAARSSSDVAVNCIQWERRLRGFGIRKPVTVIPVGSNIPRAKVTPPEVARLRESLLRGNEKLLVGCFGSAGVHRDASLLVKALQIVRRATNLRVVWLGSATSDGVSLYDDGITWTGALPHPQLSRILSACDMFVLPFSDGVSTRRGTLAAGLLHSLPIVTTRGKVLDPIFVHGENVYLVPRGNAGALAEALIRVGTSAELRAQLSRGAEALHRRHFAWNVIARALMDIVARP